MRGGSSRWMAMVAAGTLLLMGVACSAPGQQAASEDDGGNPGMEVLSKSQALERVLERSLPKPAPGGTAPSFVPDPGWPKPLPNNWIIGEIGGLTVDSHDNIWVYHRPRSLNSTDAGALGEAGKNAKGQPISAIGHPRPYGQHSGCCVPAPSVLQFDKAGNLLQAWGGPGDPGFLETRCPATEGCYWPGREHGIFVDHNDFVWIAGNGEIDRGTNSGEYPWAANFGGDDSQILKFKSDGSFVFAIGTQGMKKPNSNDTNGGINGTPQPYLPADFTVDPKTNILYVADGYGNRRVLLADAATGKYIGHFGAYGQNPVIGESTDAAYGGAWAADFRRGELKPKFFRSPLHCAELSDDGFCTCATAATTASRSSRHLKSGSPVRTRTARRASAGLSVRSTCRQRRQGERLAAWRSQPIPNRVASTSRISRTSRSMPSTERRCRRSIGSAVAAGGSASSTGRTRSAWIQRATCTPAKWTAAGMCRSSCATARPPAAARATPKSAGFARRASPLEAWFVA